MLADLNTTERGMIEERHILNYVGETMVVELRCCSGCLGKHEKYQYVYPVT
jgi:hypothetical protein